MLRCAQADRSRARVMVPLSLMHRLHASASARTAGKARTAMILCVLRWMARFALDVVTVLKGNASANWSARPTENTRNCGGVPPAMILCVPRSRSVMTWLYAVGQRMGCPSSRLTALVHAGARMEFNRPIVQRLRHRRLRHHPLRHQLRHQFLASCVRPAAGHHGRSAISRVMAAYLIATGS